MPGQDEGDSGPRAKLLVVAQEGSCCVWQVEPWAGIQASRLLEPDRPGLPGQKASSASVCQLKEELLSREGLMPRRAEILFF